MRRSEKLLLLVSLALLLLTSWLVIEAVRNLDDRVDEIEEVDP